MSPFTAGAYILLILLFLNELNLNFSVGQWISYAGMDMVEAQVADSSVFSVRTIEDVALDEKRVTETALTAAAACRNGNAVTLKSRHHGLVCLCLNVNMGIATGDSQLVDLADLILREFLVLSDVNRANRFLTNAELRNTKFFELTGKEVIHSLGAAEEIGLLGRITGLTDDISIDKTGLTRPILGALIGKDIGDLDFATRLLVVLVELILECEVSLGAGTVEDCTVIRKIVLDDVSSKSSGYRYTRTANDSNDFIGVADIVMIQEPEGAGGFDLSADLPDFPVPGSEETVIIFLNGHFPIVLLKGINGRGRKGVRSGDSAAVNLCKNGDSLTGTECRNILCALGEIRNKAIGANVGGLLNDRGNLREDIDRMKLIGEILRRVEIVQCGGLILDFLCADLFQIQHGFRLIVKTLSDFFSHLICPPPSLLQFFQ